MDNSSLAESLETYASLAELDGANSFKVRALENAARTVQSSTIDIASHLRSGAKLDIKGIGESIAKTLNELVLHGKSPAIEELRAKIPAGLFDILKLPGLGPKKVRALWQELEITSLSELSYACNENRLLELKGFGKKTQTKILEGIKHLSANQGRFLYPFARSIADELARFLQSLAGVARVEVAGSLRRGRETIKDLDLLVQLSPGASPEPIMAAVRGMPIVRELIGSGETKTSVRLDSGIAVDVRVVEPSAWPYALLYFTGSKEHNVVMRRRAREHGYSLNEYALTPVDGAAPPHPMSTEEEVFAFLGLDFIAPALREDLGEVDAAASKVLPKLVDTKDIRGVLHMHTTASDGNCSIEQLCDQALALGYEYIGISDHSKAAFYANGLNEERLRDQRKQIEAARKKYPGLKIFHGLEADILSDGDIDLEDDCLAELDFVIASVHSQLGMDHEAMTQRILKAVSHPAVRVLGHPTGRLLLGRKGFSFDWDKVLDACAARGVAIECNANPHRLDADGPAIRRARAKGVKICINPDAHAAEALADTRFGVLTARRGWAEPADVVNTLSAKDFAADFLKLA